MKKSFVLILLALLLSGTLGSRGQRLRVAFWNVENLFDTIHDNGKDDREFLPDAQRHWNSSRYWRKLRGITQTIAAMGEGGELPAIVGVCEVENDSVLRDLTRRTALYNAHYRYVITDSPDQRGVDVGLLYRPESFNLYNWHPVRVPSQENGLRPTRDILVASGTVASGDTIHVCVVHLPSRQNNNLATRQNRMLAVKTLMNIADSLGLGSDDYSVKPAKMLIMGDFNAEPGDEIFDLICPPLQTLMPTDRKELRGRRGTYYFRRVWGFLDHILVSRGMLPMVTSQAKECRFPFLLRTDRQIPWRTYGGTSYLGGLSDHLPVMVELQIADGNSPK